ncbi:sal-like protein 1 isoform X2 [Liolophura sinensis]|uniref:sal-like protein 1 isoform X2 n=1 Tax=Liolophura sinensis TaxID=3198878 RepID=UPI00315820F9
MHVFHESTTRQFRKHGSSKTNTPSPTSPSRDDAHVCGRCRAEFLELAEFLAHKKTCTRKRLVVLFDEEENQERMENPAQRPRLSNPNDDADSTGERNSLEDDMDDSVSEKSDDESQEDMPPTLVNGLRHTEEDDDDDDDDEEKLLNKYNSIMDKSRLGTLKANLPQLTLPLNPFLQADNSNVMLEPLSTTKAAVAQFAENNLPSSDLAVLHSALYSLQQQQLVQLQLIQQLQGQLLLGINSSASVNVPPMPPTLTPPTPGSIGPIPPMQPPVASPNPTAATTPGLPEGGSNNPNHGSNGNPEEKMEVDVCKKEKSSSSTASTPNSIKLPPSHGEPSKNLELPSHENGKSSGPGLLSTSSSPSYTSYPQFRTGASSARSPNPTSPAIDKSQFVSDDPFFKHKCRMCHKVFGSDSALQIHIRSHTDFSWPSWSSKAFRRLHSYRLGERPFKCNICGNRFSTRGNLKVHFSRHKAKYPHVPMNPHPVPEHLDHLPNLPKQHRSHSVGSSIPSSSHRPPSTSHRHHHPAPPPPPPPPHMAPRSSEMTSSSSHSSLPSKIQLLGESSSSPVVASHHTPRSDSSPTGVGSEAPPRTSPDVKESANTSTTSQANFHRDPITSPSVSASKLTSPIISSLSSSIASMNNMIMAGPTSTLPMSLAMMSPTIMTAMPHFNPMLPPPMELPFVPPRPSSDVPEVRDENGVIMPTKTIESGENLEEYMEISKSETSKLEALVQNIEQKLTDPNQCVICHRVLSCKSALQMHYRIHTGERPFRCKICGRSFTTKGNLKTHMGVHRAKPPMRMMHQCPVCHKQFTNLLVLQQHIRMHTIGTGSEHHMPQENPFRALEWTPRPPFHDNPYGLPRSGELDLSKTSPFPPFHPPKRDPEQLMELDLSKRPSKEKMETDNCEKEAIKSESKDEDRNGELNTSTDNKERLPQSDDEISQMSGHQEDVEDEKKQKVEDRPGSAMSSESESMKSPSPRNYESPYAPYTSTLSLSGYSSMYSTSLAALEEKVRAINSVTAFKPMERLQEAELAKSDHNDNRPASPSSHSEGRFDRSLTTSPVGRAPSEAGSVGSKDDGAKSSKSYAGSICSDEGSNIYFPILSPGGTMMNLNRQNADGKPNTTCNICLKTFACRSALEIHYRSHTKERPFKCEVCDRCFSTKGNMKQHMLTHKIRDLPSEAFAEQNGEAEPTEVKQEDQTSVSSNPETPANHRPSSASSCSSETPSPFVRRGAPKHQCQVCMKHFSSASALQIHIRTHTGDKPFKCTVCGKAFTTKGNLKVHMGTHMWNNSPSRRGRRMSIEPPFMFSPKENPFLAAAAAGAFPHRSPDFFFQYPPPFLNGMSPKLNEISVIQSLNGGLGHAGPIPFVSPMTSPVSKEENHNDARTTNRERQHSGEKRQEESSEGDENVRVSSSGELDLSMKSSNSSGTSSVSPPPTSASPAREDVHESRAHSDMSPWLWKSTCHICSFVCSSPTALDHHIRSQHFREEAPAKMVA